MDPPVAGLVTQAVASAATQAVASAVALTLRCALRSPTHGREAFFGIEIRIGFPARAEKHNCPRHVEEAIGDQLS
jgi:hypothetical protein